VGPLLICMIQYFVQQYYVHQIGECGSVVAKELCNKPIMR
jgi:hypothetical protein